MSYRTAFLENVRLSPGSIQTVTQPRLGEGRQHGVSILHCRSGSRTVRGGEWEVGSIDVVWESLRQDETKTRCRVREGQGGVVLWSHQWTWTEERNCRMKDLVSIPTPVNTIDTRRVYRINVTESKWQVHINEFGSSHLICNIIL